MSNTHSLLWAILLAMSFSAFAQSGDCDFQLSDNATPFDNQNYLDWQSLGKDQVMTALTYDLANLTEDKDIEKELIEIFTERANYINGLFDKEYFLFEDSLLQVVTNLSQRLLGANEIRNEKNIRFLIARSGTPNAACLGDGTIIINLGLISRLENYEQLAFVMAHELGHHHLDHVNQGVTTRVKLWNSPEFKKRIKSSRNNKVRANAELGKLIQDNEVSLAKHSREHELETDALGFEFYKKSGFPLEHAYSGLALLQKLDQPKYTLPELSELFDFDNMPWQEHWDDSHLSGLSLVALSEEEKELYRTHPQLEERIVQIRSLGADSVGHVQPELCATSIFYDLEILENRYNQGNIFGAFLLGLKLYEVNKKNIYVNEILALCLLDFALARKAHTFSDIAPPPNRKFSEQANLAATFLDNLSYSELKGVGANFLKKNVDLSKSTDQTKLIKEKLKGLQ